MVYNTFLNQVAAQIQNSVKDCQVHLVQVRKNNGLLLDGLCMEPKNQAVSPTIYLNAYYKEYLKGCPLSDICLSILELYRTHSDLSSLDPAALRNFSAIQSRIVYRVIHAASNRQLLQEVPHIPFLDLAVVFAVLLTDTEETQMTAMVRAPHLKSWKVTAEDLYQCAKRNTPRLLPASLRSLSQVMSEILGGFTDASLPDSPGDYLEEFKPEEEYDTPLYVLTNQAGIYGAACMLYPEPIKNFADRCGADVLILPSSIHEVLITADGPDMDYNGLSRMVFEINQSDVPLPDRLSNQVYRYSRQTGGMTVVSHAPESIGKPNP